MNSKKSTIIESIQSISGVGNVSHLCISPESDDLMVVEINLRLSTEEVILRNYNALVSRSEINDETTRYDFIDKIKEAVSLLDVAVYNPDRFNEGEELSKIALWLDSYAIHYGIDLQTEKEAVMLKNEGL